MTRLKVSFAIFLCLNVILVVLYVWSGGAIIKNIIWKSVSAQEQEVSEVQVVFNRNNFPNYPEFYARNMPLPFGLGENCARFPKVFDIHYNNYHWQSLETSNGTFYLLNAYLDTRLKEWYIRIVGMVNRFDVEVKTFCQIWYEGKREPVISQVLSYDYIWDREWQHSAELQPYILACQIPEEMKSATPSSVSIVENHCDTSTTNMRVIYEKSTKRDDFAVCVKGLDYTNDDYAVRLVEWMELMNILGVKKVYFYELQTGEKLKKILDYYVGINRVQINPLTLPGGQPNIPPLQHAFLRSRIMAKRLDEVVPYNDCFYKNMYKYEYIALLDTDEVIMPIKQVNWSSLVNYVGKTYPINKTKPVDYFKFRNLYFLDSFTGEDSFDPDIPEDMHMLQHVYSSKYYNAPNEYTKSFFNTKTVKTLQNHRPFMCIPNRECVGVLVKPKHGHLQHYRSDCVIDFLDCEKFKKHIVFDDRIRKFKRELLENAERVLKYLGLRRSNDTGDGV